MSLNLKTDSKTKYKSNADIEEVLSGNFSLGKNSDEVNLKINKVNTNTPIDKSTQKIREKIELSSNKDIDIGLDLLVNKEKKANKSSDNNPLKNAYELSSENNSSSKVNGSSELTSSGDLLSGGTGVNEETTSRIEAMINDLNLDKTSRLSQEDIDRLIDNQDTKSRRAAPKLATAADIENELEGSSNLLVGNRQKKKESSSLPSDIEFESGTQQTSDQVTSDYSTSLNGNPYGNKPSGFHNTNMPQQTFNMAQQQVPQMSLEESRKKKQETLFKLEKMRRLGVQGIKHFNMSSSLPEMEEELSRVVHEREVESSVKFQRKCLMAFVTGVELLNNKMDFLDFKLDGWSEQVNDGINEYNEVFEELHEKYKEKAKMAPEVKLLFMLGGSAFMYHLSNSMFKNSIPGMEDIMKQNPELMKQFANAAINQMNNDEDRNAASFMFNNAQAARAQAPPQQFRQPPPQQFRQPPPQNNFQRTSPGMPGVVPSNRMPSQSSRSAPQYTPGPDPNMTSTSLGSDTVSELKSQPSQNERVKTPFNSGTRIQPPVGVDEILNELKSNTDSQLNEDISEVLSQGNRSISIGKRKSGSRKPRRKFNLTVGQ